MHVRIIAEAGVNHNGNLTLGKKLVEVAAKSGADFVKFQTFKTHNLVSLATPLANYQRANQSQNTTQFDLLEKLELSEGQHIELKDYCEIFKINFISTAFDIESADFLRSLGQNLFKIPSGEITDYPLLRHVGKFGTEVILSSGASTLKEINDALLVLTESGTPIEKITVLHCTSCYPAKPSDVNLLAMCTIASELGVKVGYSDHTLGIEVAIAAVALGATVIEKHFTLNKNDNGPDHKSSLEPEELNELVKCIRNIEIALGDGEKKPTENELENLKLIRKSIFAKKDIKKGEILDISNLICKRPYGGVSPMRWNEIVGSHAKQDYFKDEMIEFD